MTTEQLLYPRYKITDKWPGMHTEPFHVGQIITLQPHKEEDAEGFIYIPDKYMPKSYMWQSFFDLYKNLFQPLPWWSDRKVDELPEFVKCIKTPDQIIQPGEVLKVNWHRTGEGKVENGQWVFCYTNCYEPATFAEHKAYQQSKNNA